MQNKEKDAVYLRLAKEVQKHCKRSTMTFVNSFVHVSNGKRYFLLNSILQMVDLTPIEEYSESFPHYISRCGLFSMVNQQYLQAAGVLPINDIHPKEKELLQFTTSEISDGVDLSSTIYQRMPASWKKDRLKNLSQFEAFIQCHNAEFRYNEAEGTLSLVNSKKIECKASKRKAQYSAFCDVLNNFLSKPHPDPRSVVYIEEKQYFSLNWIFAAWKELASEEKDYIRMCLRQSSDFVMKETTKSKADYGILKADPLHMAINHVFDTHEANATNSISSFSKKSGQNECFFKINWIRNRINNRKTDGELKKIGRIIKTDELTKIFQNDEQFEVFGSYVRKRNMDWERQNVKELDVQGIGGLRNSILHLIFNANRTEENSELIQIRGNEINMLKLAWVHSRIKGNHPNLTPGICNMSNFLEHLAGIKDLTIINHCIALKSDIKDMDDENSIKTEFGNVVQNLLETTEFKKENSEICAISEGTYAHCLRLSWIKNQFNRNRSGYPLLMHVVKDYLRNDPRFFVINNCVILNDQIQTPVAQKKDIEKASSISCGKDVSKCIDNPICNILRNANYTEENSKWIMVPNYGMKLLFKVSWILDRLPEQIKKQNLEALFSINKMCKYLDQSPKFVVHGRYAHMEEVLTQMPTQDALRDTISQMCPRYCTIDHLFLNLKKSSKFAIRSKRQLKTFILEKVENVNVIENSISLTQPDPLVEGASIEQLDASPQGSENPDYAFSNVGTGYTSSLEENCGLKSIHDNFSDCDREESSQLMQISRDAFGFPNAYHGIDLLHLAPLEDDFDVDDDSLHVVGDDVEKKATAETVVITEADLGVKKPKEKDKNKCYLS